MSTSIVANRIYERKGYAAADFEQISPDDLLVRGLKPPTKTAGGLWTPDAGASGEAPTETKDYAVRACVAFEVVKLPVEMSKGNPHNLSPGDVVACRNALVDPLLGNELAITNMYLGVIGVLERAARAEAA